MKKHLKIRHSEQEEATCPYCHKPFRNKYSLWTHVNSYHPQAKAVHLQQSSFPVGKLSIVQQKPLQHGPSHSSSIAGSSSSSSSAMILRHSDPPLGAHHSCVSYSGPSTSGLSLDIRQFGGGPEDVPPQSYQPYPGEVIRSSPVSETELYGPSHSHPSTSACDEHTGRSAVEQASSSPSRRSESPTPYLLRSSSPDPDYGSSASTSQHQRPMD